MTTLSEMEQFAEYLVKRLSESDKEVLLPRHLFIPKDAETADMGALVNVPAGSVNEVLWEYTAKKSEFITFINYRIFNEGLDQADFELVPTVDGDRILKYHGDPEDNFKIALSSGSDLSMQNAINCLVKLRPGQTLSWLVTNNSAAAVRMGVKMLGYVENRFVGDASGY